MPIYNLYCMNGARKLVDHFDRFIQRIILQQLAKAHVQPITIPDFLRWKPDSYAIRNGAQYQRITVPFCQGLFLASTKSILYILLQLVQKWHLGSQPNKKTVFVPVAFALEFENKIVERSLRIK